MNAKPPIRARRGLSVLELVGCLLAVVIGIWVGTAYLGVDLRSAWQIGMEKSGVANSPTSPGDSAQSDEAELLSGDEPAVHAQPGSSTTSSPSEAQPADQSAARRTLAYWTKLQHIARQEQLSKHQGEQDAFGNPRAALLAREQAYRKAAEAVRQLPLLDVDPEAGQLAQEIAAWYERGAELSHQGAFLLEEADLTGTPGPLGRRWQTAEKQHREELNLLSRKISSLQSKLATRYRLHFPELR